MDLIAFADVVPAVNQMETNLFHQRVDYQDLLHAEGVQLKAWAPFAEGKNDLFTSPVLTEIGDAHRKSVAQVVLRWLVQRGAVVVFKPSSPNACARTSTSSTSSSSRSNWQNCQSRGGRVSVFLPRRS